MTIIINGRHVKRATDPSLRYVGAQLWTNGRNIEPGWNWTAHFDVHPVEREDWHPGIIEDRPEAWDWYQQQNDGRPIFLLAKRAEVPASIAFPRADVQRWAAQWDSETEFRTSICWSIAYALMQRPERLVLHNVGVEVEHNREWVAAHAQGIAYWISAARFLKVQVIVEGLSIFAPPREVYGFEHGGPRYGWRATLPRRMRA